MVEARVDLPELAEQLEAEGYARFEKAVAGA